jgi:CDP-diacylglycerol--glycerol-3-phosphate 3-phosphatidyltransferase
MIFIIISEKDLFVFFICFNLFTDFLDGWIARRYNQITEIGSAIDSLADTGTYFLALAGIIAFKRAYFQPYAISLSIFFGLLLLADLLPLIKFGKFNAYHTYSAKIGAYLKGLFIIVLFTAGFYLWFYYLVIITGMLIFLESIIITFILNESRSDVKGLYWIMKGSKKIR